MKFSIIIPAYNEEKSIGDTIERTLSAKDRIVKLTKYNEVEIIIVNDGSKDNTPEIVRRYLGVILIDNPINKGYGAALKEGFLSTNSDLLGFIDADGTCDPLFFLELIKVLHVQDADIALGSRLGVDSQMPKIRMIGNKFFALLINFFGNSKIIDSASGMRVFKKGVLEKLYPLPDGLHFTPAMSCKAVMNKEVKIIEIPMPYKERVGASKLRICKDGIRFLRVILEAVLFYKPLKFLSSIGIFLISIALIYLFKPIFYYLCYGRIEEDFIYRLISIVVFCLVGFNFIILGFLGSEMAAVMNSQKIFLEKVRNRWLKSLFCPRSFLIIGVIMSMFGVLINIGSIREYVYAGKILTHWVYILVGGFLVLLGAQIITYGFFYKIILLFSEKFSLIGRDRKAS
jgi:glycosyltransferase involved in cell wall biosynthesis